MRKSTFLGSIALVLLTTVVFSQEFRQYQPGVIRQKLEKLNVLGTVLYVAAHPDDENTRLIAYYANGELMRTGYLAATRGDGGQNLIGPEIREELGVIRTQELLAARGVDGGSQFFSRANDFGYSKNPDETFTIWDREQVLSDFVWVFRNFRPDVIITRFNDEGPNHGHHTASAILAKEAFELAGKEDAFPDQLTGVDPWQPAKIYWNTGWWWFRNSGQDTTSLLKINVGEYNPLMGESYGEIAARSRSMHKSQGFGSSGSRGDQIEYLEQWGGQPTDDPFEGIETSWQRVDGSEEVAFYVKKAIKEYDVAKPWSIVESLVLARRALDKINDPFWQEVKRQEIDELMMATTGLYLSVQSDAASYAVGDSIAMALEAVNRSQVEISLKEIQFNTWVNPVQFGADLLPNKRFVSEMNYKLPAGMKYSNPYWLSEPATLGMYTVNDQNKIGKPENDAPITGTVKLDIGGEELLIKIPVVFKRTDPVEGEVTEPLTVGPPVMMNVDASVLVFGDGNSKSVDVRVIAGKKNCQGEIKLDLPQGWQSVPSTQSFSISRKGEESIFTFEVTPPKKASEGKITVVADLNGKKYSKGRVVIDYDHIPTQTLYPEAEVKVVRLDLVKKGSRIGYIVGAGDAIPENLEQVGYQVDRLSKDDVSVENLSQYDAVILGVRAFNTVDWLAYKNEDLFDYVAKGGNLIVQYNTSHRLVTPKVAPYDLKLSRERVTMEDAPVSVLNSGHPLMTSPNKITERDFENWVQERGLYFPNEWSDEFVPILSSNDPGESPKTGGLLVAKYGEGYYVYSGYSWFRELPAGVSGAYRIFVNMISLGK